MGVRLTFQDTSHAFPGVPQRTLATVHARVAGVAGALTTAGHALAPGGPATHGQGPRGYGTHHIGYEAVLRAAACKMTSMVLVTRGCKVETKDMVRGLTRLTHSFCGNL